MQRTHNSSKASPILARSTCANGEMVDTTALEAVVLTDVEVQVLFCAPGRLAQR